MATFVKGDWVEVCPYPDYSWEHWSQENTDMCKKRGKITGIMKGEWVDETYIEVEYRGVRTWFRDDHLIKVENYEHIFSESIHEACEQLQKNEAICKRLRDEILEGVFGDGTSPQVSNDDEESIFEDWQEVTTKEVIPLPGNGGTMTTPSDPKASADDRRKKIRNIKKLGKKISNKKTNKQQASGSLSSSWSLTDEELQDLQDYIDSLPWLDSFDSSGDIDFNYNFEYDDDWGPDGNAD